MSDCNLWHYFIAQHLYECSDDYLEDIGEALSGYKLIQVNVRIKNWSAAICSFVHYIMCTDVVISEWFI